MPITNEEGRQTRNELDGNGSERGVFSGGDMEQNSRNAGEIYLRGKSGCGHDKQARKKPLLRSPTGDEFYQESRHKCADAYSDQPACEDCSDGQLVSKKGYKHLTHEHHLRDRGEYAEAENGNQDFGTDGHIKKETTDITDYGMVQSCHFDFLSESSV